MIEGRLPPHNIDAEENVISSLLIDGELIHGLALEHSDFYHEENATLYSACKTVERRGVSINQVTIAQELSERGKLETIGGVAFLSHLIATCATPLDCRFYADIVKRLATHRSLILAGEKIAELGYKQGPDITDSLHRVDEILLSLRSTSLVEPKTGISEDAPILRNISEVEPESVSWLWKPYIPFGKLTLLEGDPGVGKSWVALALTTAMSLGHGLPFQGENAEGPVLIASAEDGLADTIRPRLDKMGANLSSIKAIDGLFTLDEAGFSLLETWVESFIPGLLIIDPLVAYFSGDMDINKANQVRYGTARLAKLATKWGLAIVAVRHLTKGGSLKPIYRGLGSIDFTASARSVLLAGCDPDNPQVRGLIHIKHNLSTEGVPIGYEIREDGFLWTDHCDLTADKIFQATDGGNALNEAKTFLLEVLASGEQAAKECFEEAKTRGISEVTLKRAKGDMGVLTYRIGEKGKEGGGKWFWKMPENLPKE